MSTIRKLSHFRQLSLNCESPSPHQRRKSLKKQYSEDIPDFKDPWIDQCQDIRVSLNSKNKKNDKPPLLKNAWEEKSETKNDNISEESVIIKKCKEVKRVTSAKLTRHASLEKDSILNSKQDLAERLKRQNNEKENGKTEIKPNLQIFLAHNTQEHKDELSDSDQYPEKTQPKYLQPLGQNNNFQIRKSAPKKPLDSPSVPTRPNFCRSNTIVVVPFIDKEEDNPANATDGIEKDTLEPKDTSGINVVIRPVTAQMRREKFQKRTNSAFHGTSKDQPTNFRPPLVRSSSAPSTKPEKSKFLATKRKLKSSKKIPKEEEKSSRNVEAKEWKNAAQSQPEIVTMVSLVSPSGSDNEEEEEEGVKERPKSVLKRESSVVEKGVVGGVTEEGGGNEIAKNLSLRKTVKSVSFQQSSIHAVRSFSASFPARRGSMATALLVGSNNGNVGTAKSALSMPKAQEKRGTNPSSPDADERVPKRRLVRSNTEETKSNWQNRSVDKTPQQKKPFAQTEVGTCFTIDIHTKAQETEENNPDLSLKLELEENVILVTTEETKEASANEEEKPANTPTYDTPKEKQCWAMYCKMTEKGINVSYDTILRGMLTPTEYRMRRKTSIAEEMNLLINPPSTESKTSVPQSSTQ